MSDHTPSASSPVPPLSWSDSMSARRDRRHRGRTALMERMRWVVPAVALAACTNGIPEAQPGGGGGGSSGGTEPPDCSAQPTTADSDLPAEPTAATIAVAQSVFPICADTVVLAEVSSIGHGSDLALAAEAPLLVIDPTADAVPITTELARLDPGRIVWTGPPEVRSDVETLVGQSLTQAEPPAAPASPEPPTAPDATTDDPAPPAASMRPMWIAAPEQADTAVAVTPTLRAGGATVQVLESLEPETLGATLANVEAGTVHYFEGIDDTDRWRIGLAVDPVELPGGGTEVFPDRRVLAFYGSPITFRLGLLGEQGPQETIDLMRPVIDSYRIGDETIVPGFELIATVADSSAGDDGNYSNELDPEVLREWIDAATANDAFVIIDLQPGRTDFLTQAKLYEEYLRLPNVGLALDPEWRIGPDEVHLVQVGSVTASEVNEVVDYLTAIVREEGLPQKILVLHQFQTRMITDRESVRTPPELAVVVHVDGQGPLSTKYGTYDTLVTDPQGPDQTLWWGWKNFLDEDTPMATPEQTNAVTPLPVVITFQ